MTTTTRQTFACFHVVENNGELSGMLIESYLTEAEARQAAAEINARWGAEEVIVTSGRYWADFFDL